MNVSRLSRYLPSKRFVIIVSLGILIFGGGAFAVFISTHRATPVVNTKSPDVIITEEDVLLAATDTDGDGLAAWEEALWGTNPNVADTDGDGTIDGIEIAARRNPLINQEDDSLTSYPLVPGTAEDVNNGETTRTNALARAFMSSLYASSQQEGGTTPEDIDVLNELLATEVLQNAIPDPYTTSDIIVGNDSDETLRAYANVLGAHIEAYNKLGAPYELTIISEAITREQFSNLHDLERFAIFFAHVASDLEKAQAPQSLANTHLILINSIAVMSESLARIADTENDVVLGFSGLAQYQTTLAAFGESVHTIAESVTNRNIIFSPSESGKAFILPVE